MLTSNFSAARAFLLVALPLSAVVASAQGARSTITSFDRFGNATIQDTSGDPNRSSVTTFDRNGVPTIQYTAPPLNPIGIQQPQSIAGLISNQNIYGQSAPNPTRFGYFNGPIYPPGYGYPAPSYGYPAPGYGYPAYGYGYPAQENAYNVQIGASNLPWTIPASITSIPLGTNYTYPAPFPVPAYGYPAPYPVPANGYPAPVYPYPYGYGGGTYSSNTANYGVSFGRGGFNASIGGSNTSSTSRSTTTIITR